MPRIGPYTFTQSLRWLYRYGFGPTRRHRGLHDPLPRNWKSGVAIDSRLRVCFAGDLMSNKGKRLCFGSGIASFLEGCDLLVLNLEGLLVDKTDLVLVKQYSSDSLLDDLEDLFPLKKTLFSLGNNHAGDFGREDFEQTVAKIEARGAQVFGTARRPSLRLAEKVSLTGATTLSNQPANFLSWLLDAHPDPTCDLNLLFLHWGEEFVVYPGPEQIAEGKLLLECWNAVIGHHSHCPGPVVTFPVAGEARPLAYSLGDFSVFFTARVIRHGCLLRLEMGPDSRGIWQIGSLEQSYCFVQRVDQMGIHIALQEQCPVL
jgi:hypothetical protein